MLDFGKVRKSTDEMLVKAQECTEKFWQEIFDYFDYCPDMPLYNGAYGLDIVSSENLYFMFRSLNFTVERTCYGRITVKFDNTNSEEAEIAFQLATDCLLNNYFNRIDEHTFVLSNVHENTT